MKTTLHVGLDVGSTTVKVAALDSYNQLVYQHYERHFSDIHQTVKRLLTEVYQAFSDKWITVSVTGSSGIAIADCLNLEFVQEVFACSQAVEAFIPATDVAIELGGEDAKITYWGATPELRMNGTCAGGTGAFIDQMAALLKTDAAGLNDLAREYKQIYPIASRCGVFAKTDIQPLLNEGAAKSDIAASIFQAVVNQTISGLACGKPIRGKVAFLGGPLFFLPELRQRFIETLALPPEDIIVPDYAQYFVAEGAALTSRQQKAIPFNWLYHKLNRLGKQMRQQNLNLPPLFEDEREYRQFLEQHQHQVERAELAQTQGACFLGIDAGSTTTKLALADADGRLLYSHYGSNGGSPLVSTIAALTELYRQMPAGSFIGRATVTGYGEALLKAALCVDSGEIETVAHHRGAEHFLPGVDFILDIGGQDMKCLQIKDGVITSIMLNEACSSGCGSFIESLSKSLEIDLETFVQQGLFSKYPVDLGTRCTVFMNSKIKQVQKEGADIGAIAAGLAYSVVKNALYKVIRLRNANAIGSRIVVQGGTFYNDAVLRSFERVIGKVVVRPDIAGIMGAYGAALLSRDQYVSGQSSLLPAEALTDFVVRNRTDHCQLCGNQCLLTISTFPDGRTFTTGNRCERGAGGEKTDADIPNLSRYKYRRLFQYAPLPLKQATRGEIGIPRVLNLYAHYPFWFTFFTQLGFRVVLSGRSSKQLFTLGMETIPSESLCYPAKLANGHVMDLIDKGVKTIFYPCIPREQREREDAPNNYNCPVVASYPEVIKVNIDALRDQGVRFIYPFLPIESPEHMKNRMFQEMKPWKISRREIDIALVAAYAEREACARDIAAKGEEALRWMELNHRKGIILAGRPYHVDPEIHHGIPEMITGLGLAVLTEDSVCHLAPKEYPLEVVNQWVYHSRLYAAAALAGQRDDVELVQLNSFGCGLDAVTTDQVEEILTRNRKTYTLVKIDEINNLGAVRIRIRSLLAAMQEREKKGVLPSSTYRQADRIIFTKDMRENYTILAPQMAPIHFALFEELLRQEGYNLEILPDEGPEVVEQGLLHVHNDACYPSILVIGQMMAALKSGRYDLNRTALVMSQTGGGCRASNYIAFIRKALREAGMEQVPVISANALGWEKNPGFKLSLSMVKKGVMACLYGDLLMKLTYATRPYETQPDKTNQTLDLCTELFKQALPTLQKRSFRRLVNTTLARYTAIPVDLRAKPKVGIVGEILVKYHPFANNFIVDTIEKEGGEAVVPGLIEFFLASVANTEFTQRYLVGSRRSVTLARLAERWVNSYYAIIREALAASARYETALTIRQLAELTESMMQLGHQSGEGWLLTGEMMELLHSGVDNIACLQPFACLPNHIVGKGMIRELRRHYPQANIVPLDYDPGASSVNQVNRIKLMMSVAYRNLEQRQAEQSAAARNKKSFSSPVDWEAVSLLYDKRGRFLNL
jgi:predicted CoA-substrate-specific enzyme activase